MLGEKLMTVSILMSIGWKNVLIVVVVDVEIN